MYGSQTQSGHGFGQPNPGRGYQVKILGRTNLASPVFIYRNTEFNKKDEIFPP